MILVREICERGHAIRKEHKIKVRQPVKKCKVKSIKGKVEDELLELIKEELNVKDVEITVGAGELAVTLDTTITPELEKEGDARELIRQIQMLRKEKGCKIDEGVAVTLPQVYRSLPRPLLDIIKKETLATKLTWGEALSISTG